MKVELEFSDAENDIFLRRRTLFLRFLKVAVKSIYTFSITVPTLVMATTAFDTFKTNKQMHEINIYST